MSDKKFLLNLTKEQKTGAMCILLVVIAILGFVIWKNNRWKYELDLTYIDSVSYRNEPFKVEYYEYEVKNKTKRELEDVTVVIVVEDKIFSKKLELEYQIGTLREGETDTFKIYETWLEKNIEEKDPDFWYCGFHIKKITYK